jgi:tetratricopeptide (TPR) repeat protein
MKRMSFAIVLAFMLIFTMTCFVQAETTKDAFRQALREYQSAPSFEAAKKVARLAAEMKELPAIPEEARRHFVRGSALFEEAKSQNDFTQATNEFVQAASLAPWWPKARYNTALASEAEGDYANAIANLKIYQQFKLSSKEAQAVQDKIWKLEIKKEMEAAANAKQKTIKDREAAEAQQKARAEAQIIVSMNNGTWCEKAQFHIYGSQCASGGGGRASIQININGNQFNMQIDWHNYSFYEYRGTIEGLNLRGVLNASNPSGGFYQTKSFTGNVNSDGNEIAITLEDGSRHEYVRIR